MTKRTTTEAELREWIAQGKTKREIGEILGMHQVRVSAACGVLGLNKPTPKKGQRAPVQEYLADLRLGLSLTEISKKHGVGYQSVYLALKRAGLPTCARALLRAESAAKQQDNYIQAA